MNRINRQKLRHSKWTAVRPVDKRRHFIVSDVIRSNQGCVVECVLQAVIDRHEYRLAWRDLADDDRWLTGWR